MSAPVLATRGLDKSFGSLVVAKDIEIALPRGVRYALIGPNGAGKTTLINLMTGMLRPDGGQIMLGGEDITALGPEERVRRGLVRTFQINSLFPHLNPLEAVTLAICERERIARTWWRPTSDYRAAVDEAYGILKSLMLGPVCIRETRELAYGQQRLLEIALALATRPKVLLLDEPAAGVPREESAELFTAITSLSQDITVLFIEHDMELVFRLASRIIVMVGGRILVEGTPDEISADPRVREVYLGGAHMAEPLLAFKNVRAGYGEAVVLDDITLRDARARQPRGARAQRRRQEHAAADLDGLHPASPRRDRLARHRHHPACRRTAARDPASAGWRRSARFSPTSRSRRT